MKKLCLLIFLSNCIFSFYAQSKKHKIEILNYRLDSLNQVLIIERINNNHKLSDLNAKIYSLENENIKLEKYRSELSVNSTLLKQDISSLNVLIRKNEIEYSC